MVVVKISEEFFPAPEYDRFRCEFLGVLFHRLSLAVSRFAVVVEWQGLLDGFPITSCKE